MPAQFRLIENVSGTYTLATEAGALARTTNEGKVFITSDRALAEEALAYLNQPVEGLAKRNGSHRMKSMFGPL
jgi:hypothetical protein